MDKQEHTFHYFQTLRLESGETLPGFQLQYTTLGTLNEQRNNVIWIMHALTGNSDFTSWWRPLFQPGSVFDPQHYYIICVNVLGGCYGSTGPLSVNPTTGKPYYHHFPRLTNQDVVHAFDLLRNHLRINSIHTLIGGSLGGQQALAWSIHQPEVFNHVILIACNASHSPWGIAFNEAQRMAIEADATWTLNDARAGSEGLKAARAMGMLSYRTYDIFDETQHDTTRHASANFRAASYQRYQGNKLANRFNAFTYYLLTRMMDSQHVGRTTSIREALQQIKAKTLIVGIDSDLLFPVREQILLAREISQAKLRIISSRYGHDAFLAEPELIHDAVAEFYHRNTVRSKRDVLLSLQQHF